MKRRDFVIFTAVCGLGLGIGAQNLPAQTFSRITTGPLVTDSAQRLASAWADFDGDGDLDAFLPTTANADNFLYRNLGGGTFQNLASSPAASAGGDSTSAIWGDYDNDGRLDLFVANRWQNHFLYRGTGGGALVSVTDSVVVTNSAEAYHAAWVDYDHDGHLDLFVVRPFAASQLFRNNGNGTFEADTGSALAQNSGVRIGSAWGDYNNDGRTDVFIAGANGEPDQLFRNGGSGVFISSGTGPMVNDNAGAISATWGDYNNDGYLDLFVANRDGVNFLYRNDAGLGFTKIESGDIVTDVADSNAGAWGDFDNDGWLDLYVANGDVPATQANSFYRNNGNGTFTRIATGTPATDVEHSTSAVWVDYDNDGDLDLFCANASGGNALYQNDGNTNHWLKVNLAGTFSNRAAIGAKVRVRATISGNSRTLLRQVPGEAGLGSQNLQLHFGLGNAAVVDELRVEWPSGVVTTLTGVAVNQSLSITEGSASFSLVVPAGLQGADGNYYSGTLHEPTLRMQVVYGGSNFPAGPLTITELRFRRDKNEPPFGTSTAAATVKLSTTARNPGGLSTTFSENAGSNETTVFNGNWTFSSPSVVPNGTVRPFEIVLPLSTPFTYDPAAGNLLFDIRITSNTSLNWTDGQSGAQASRVASLNANALTGVAEATGDVIQLVYRTAATLQIQPAAGTFTNSVQVSISSSVPSGEIRYTTNGTEPTISSTAYSAPFTLTQTTTVKARLFVNGFPASDIVEAIYTRYVPPDIQFIPPGQLFTNQISVSLVNHVGAGGIRYTVDGTAPSATSPAYAAPINLTAGATIRARVFLNTFPISDEFQETYSRVYAFADDGVPFNWREQHFGAGFLTNPNAAAGADPDNDGYTNREEFEQGTLPTDGASKPEIVLVVRAVPKLTFSTLPGRAYRIERTTSLNPPDWQVLVPQVIAGGTSLEHVDAHAPDNAYYRIVLVP